MKKKTAVKELEDFVSEMVPPAGTDEKLLLLQSQLSKILYEIGQNTAKKEKEQLREAFYKGVTRNVLGSFSPSNFVEFEQYYEEHYGKGKY